MSSPCTVLGTVFTTCHNNPSTEPNIKMFQTFQQQWKNIYKNKFQTIEEN